MAYKFQSIPFAFTGVNLKSEPSALKPGQLRRAVNVRPAIDYGLEPRQGTTTFTPSSSGSPYHTVRYLNDPVTGTPLYWGGASHSLFNLATSATIDTGYSSNPLTDVPYRLSGTSVAWDIIGDAAQMRKINSSGTAYQLGVTPPAVAATSVVQAVATTSIDGFTVDSGYSYSGVASHGIVGGSLQIVTNAGPGFSSLGHASVVDLTLVGPFQSLPSDLFNLLITVDTPANIQAIEILINTGGTDYFICLLEAPALTPGTNTQTNVQIPKSSFFGTANANWATAASYYVSFYIAPSATATILLQNFYLSGGAGPNSSVGVGYDYRWTWQNNMTLSESNPSIIQGSLVYPVVQGVALSGVASVDPQVNTMRWWRRGGTLADAWRLIGVQANLTTITVVGASWLANVATITTIVPHGFLSGQGALIAGVTPSGYNTQTQITVTGPSTFTFELLSNPGGYTGGGTVQFLDIATDQSIASAAEVSLFNDQPITTVNSVGQTLYGQPLPCIWGPYSGTTIFGCGDPNQPGYAYWCNPSNPDGWSSINNIEVTQPSDPLQNGFFWNGAAYVFSQEKLFQLQPTPVGGSLLTYFPVDMVVGTGLFARWAIAASPHTPAVWFFGKDGIYEWTGGPATLISDDLWPLFHNQTAEGNAPVSLAFPKLIKLAYYDGELRLSFVDTMGTQQVWICDIQHGHRWRQATYPWSVRDIYAVPEIGNVLLYGGSDGNVYQESQQQTVTSDGNGAGTSPIACDIRTLSWNGGDGRAEKLYGDFGIDLDAQGATVTVTPGFNYYTSTTTPYAFNQSGRTTVQVDINAGQGQLAFTATADISWSSATATPIIYGWEPSLVIKPENTILRFTDPEDAGVFAAKHVRGLILEADTLNQIRSIQLQADSGVNGAFQNVNTPLVVQHNGQCEIAYAFVPFIAHNLRIAPTDANPWRLFKWRWLFDEYPEDVALYGQWTNDGWPGAKFVQGMVLEADSLGTNVVLQIQGDGGVVLEALTVNFNGRSEIAFPQASGDWVPFVTHNLRIVPQAPIRIFGVRWIWTKLPEAATRWRTQFTTNGLQGWDSVYDGYISHISTAPLTFTVTPDTGSVMSVTIPSSGGVFTKTLFQFPTNKFKSCQWEITSTQPARIFLKDLEVHMRQWNGDDVIRRPFGEVTQDGAAI